MYKLHARSEQKKNKTKHKVEKPDNNQPPVWDGYPKLGEMIPEARAKTHTLLTFPDMSH